MMSNFDSLLNGFASAITPINILFGLLVKFSSTK